MVSAVIYLPAPAAGGLTHHAATGLSLGSAAVTVLVAILIIGGLGSAALRLWPGYQGYRGGGGAGRYSRRRGGWLLVVPGGAALVALAVAGWWLAAYIRAHAYETALAVGAVVAAGLLLMAIMAAGRRVIRGPRRPRWLTLQRRLRWHLPPGPGFASWWALWRYHGLPAARRVARHARPSMSWLDRRLPGHWRGFAAFDGWASGLWRRYRVYSPVESMRLIIAPPQEGKSAAAAGTILDAPGAVVATSIRGDLIAATAGLRARAGQLHIWNPEGVGDYASTVAWNPAEGCQDMVTAVRRAGYMVEASTSRGLSDESFWSDQASLVLASYLHAAALAGGDLQHVHRWVLEEDDQPVRILARHDGAEPQALAQATSYLSLPARTRAGILATINNTLRFMAHPGVVAAVSPAPGEGFGFEDFLSGANTLYLVAADAATSPTAPLFTAMAAEITWHARQIGAARPGGRLDPPLSMVLDEVANIAPVPAAAWATWAAGSGVWLHLYAQSWAQLAGRWGDHGAEVIWQACKTKIVYTATSEPRLIALAEELCGTIRVRGPDEWRPSRTGRNRRRPTYQDVPVLPRAELRQLPAGHALVIQGTAPPVIVRPEKFWKRADVRRQHGAITLPGPAQRQIPVPVPGLLAPPGQVPSHLTPGGAGLAGRRDAGQPGAPHWADGLPEIPREVFRPAATEPDPPPRRRKTPKPPSRPAPWEPPGDERSQP